MYNEPYQAHCIQPDGRSHLIIYSETCLKKEDQKLVFKTEYRLMQVKSIADCSKGSIMQYFRPSLSYHLSLRSLFCLFLSGRLRQVLLYNGLRKKFE